MFLFRRLGACCGVVMRVRDVSQYDSGEISLEGRDIVD